MTRKESDAVNGNGKSKQEGAMSPTARKTADVTWSIGIKPVDDRQLNDPGSSVSQRVQAVVQAACWSTVEDVE